MKTRALLLGAALPCATALVLAACESDEADPPPVETPKEAGASLPDASPRDAAADAADAGPKRCSDDGFCPTVVPPNETLRGVWGDGTVVWSVSEQGDVLRWDGAAWTIHTTGLGPLYAVWGSGPTDLWLGGAHGLYHGTGASSGALTFTHEPGPDDSKVAILSIWGRGPSEIWASGGTFSWTGNVSRLLHRRAGEGGAGWSVVSVNDALVFHHVWGTAAGDVWLVGSDIPEFGSSVLYHLAPSADAFTAVPVTAYDPARGPIEGLLRGISGGITTADGTLLLAGTAVTDEQPGYWYGRPTPDGDRSWSYGARDHKDERLVAFWNAGPNATWVAGGYGRLRLWDGGKWRPGSTKITAYPLVEPLYGIWGSAPDDFWVVGKNTALHRSPSAEGSR